MQPNEPQRDRPAKNHSDMAESLDADLRRFSKKENKSILVIRCKGGIIHLFLSWDFDCQRNWHRGISAAGAVPQQGLNIILVSMEARGILLVAEKDQYLGG